MIGHIGQTLPYSINLAGFDVFIFGWFGCFNGLFFLAMDGLISGLADALGMCFLFLLDSRHDLGLGYGSFGLDASIVKDVGSLGISMQTGLFLLLVLLGLGAALVFVGLLEAVLLVLLGVFGLKLVEVALQVAGLLGLGDLLAGDGLVSFA